MVRPQYNIQFYNQGLYEDCNGLINTAGSPFTGSALLQIPANGFDINKLVIGKPAVAADATSGGYIDPSTLATCVSQAKSKGWNAGVMSWEVRQSSPMALRHLLTALVVPGRR